MGLAVRIVKRPGAELIDIALIIPEYLIIPCTNYEI